MKLHSEYVPRNSNADSTLRINFTALPGHFNSATVLSQDETIAMLDPPCLFLAHSPSIHTMSTRVYLVKILSKFVDLPDKSTSPKLSSSVEGFEEYPMEPESAGAEGIFN